MTAPEQDSLERFRARLEAMSPAEVEQYWAEREETERLAKLQRAHREHIRHQLGFALMWLSSIAIAFGVGYSQNRRFGQAAALILVWSTVGVFFFGLHLMTMNKHRRDQ